MVIARELTKIHETVVKTTLADAPQIIDEVPYMDKGEFVILLRGAHSNRIHAGLNNEQLQILRVIMKECSLKTAVALVVNITGVSKKTVYDAALRIAKM